MPAELRRARRTTFYADSTRRADVCEAAWQLPIRGRADARREDLDVDTRGKVHQRRWGQRLAHAVGKNELVEQGTDAGALQGVGRVMYLDGPQRPPTLDVEQVTLD